MSSPLSSTSNIRTDPKSNLGPRPTTPLSERLDSLLSNSQNASPRSSEEISKSEGSSESRSEERTSTSTQMPMPKLQTLRASTPPNLSITSTRTWRPTRMLGERRASSEGPSSPTTSKALQEAMEDDESLFSPSKLISRPPLARLGPSNVSRTPSHLRRPPPFSTLTRSTLPTASLTKFPPPIHRPSDPPPISESDLGPALSGSPPGRTSIESLRSLNLRDRGMHTSAASPQKPSPTSWWWQQSENKAAVDRLLDEDDKSETAEGEGNKIRQKYLAPRHPIVFCHGLLGFDTVKVGPFYPLQVSHWRGIKEVLEANGIEVLITRVPATSSIEERAAVLEQTVSDAYPGRSVHLIGHSMGGLDCRYLVTHLSMRTFKVLSVTTLATPHRGSSFADHFIDTIGRERMPSVAALLEILPNGGGDGRAFDSLTIESMRKFNESTPDIHGVRYSSWGASFTPSLLDPFKWSHSVILEKEGSNDGLVSVESAKWGTYLGTLEGVNHLDLIGWISNPRYKWAEWIGKEIKFKPATFYLGVADYLAKEVEGQLPEEMSASEPQSETEALQSDTTKDHETARPIPDMPGVKVKEVEGSKA